MQDNAAFHLGLHCLQKYWFRGFPNTKGLTIGSKDVCLDLHTDREINGWLSQDMCFTSRSIR